MKNNNKSILAAPIERRIFLIRGQRVMLDFHLAGLYGVGTKILKRSVRRNYSRFPEDFMFELSKPEYDSLRCQIGTLEKGGHSKYLPFAFTEQGVAMLSTVLRSRQAIQMNILIMRAFVKLREMLATHKDIEEKLGELERRIGEHDEHIQTLFEAIRQLIDPPMQRNRRIGFSIKETSIRYRVRIKPVKKGKKQVSVK